MARRRRGPIALTLALAVVASCSGSTDLPDAVEVTLVPTTTVVTAAPPECSAGEAAQDATRSFAPEGSLPAPGDMPPGSAMDEIFERGRLIVGVSADTLLFGSRNPQTTRIEGFDVDMLKEVAMAIFGADDEVDSHIEYRVISYAQRLPALEAGDVDIVAHTMTINCNRWLRINFSSQYYAAGQKVLVERGSGYASIAELDAAGARVCAPEGSTNIDEIRDTTTYPGLVVVGKPDITDCLVAMQEGTADATTGDDTVLAGFAAQDPTTEVVGEAFTEEPYGLGISKERVDLTRFVNGVLEEVRTSGRWTEIYTTWLLDTGALPGPPPDPPIAQYGREP
jgi:polar amino acid transport system substrate-binding protein